MILPRWADFRQRFALRAEPGIITVTFVAGTPATITRSSGSFDDEGFAAGHRLDIIGSASNDGQKLIEIVGDGPAVITLAAGETLVNEGPVACALVGGFYDNDGAPQWPIHRMRAFGFDDGITVVSAASTPWWAALGTGAAKLTVNAQAADAVAHTDEYDWYLSQRTDVAARQLWELTAEPISGGNTRSGTVRLQLSVAGQSLFGTSLDTEEIPEALKYVHIYVQKKVGSEDGIQWLDLYRHAMGAI